MPEQSCQNLFVGNTWVSEYRLQEKIAGIGLPRNMLGVSGLSSIGGTVAETGVSEYGWREKVAETAVSEYTAVVGKRLLEQGCPNIVVGESLPEQGCRNMVGGKRLLEQGCRNMVVVESCRNRGGGIRLAEKVAGTGMSEYGSWRSLPEQGCLIMVDAKRLLEEGCRNMVVAEACLNRGGGIPLVGKGCWNRGVEIWLKGKACRNMVCKLIIAGSCVRIHMVRGKGGRNNGVEMLVPHRDLPKPYEKDEE